MFNNIYMSSAIQLQNIEIEDSVVMNAIIDVIKSDKQVLNQLKSSIFSNLELVDTRTDQEIERVS